MTLDRLPRILLRLEGLAAFGGAIALYLHADYSLLALVLLFLAPDLSLFGYFAGPRTGAMVYDTVHTYVAPLALGAAGVLADAAVAVQIALIWLAHIGGDRALGYGLKYPGGFEDNHLQRI